jgi:nucleotide-binding universal stress UspA family protein
MSIEGHVMIKDIVVNLPLTSKPNATTSFATSLAGFFNAHLSGIAFIYEPIIPVVEIGAAVSAKYIEEQEAEAKKLAQAAIDNFNFEIRREAISSATHSIETSDAGAPGRFAEIARGFDLAIVSQSKPDALKMNDLIAEATFFESGRPTLIVPYIQRGAFRPDRVVICWDGSRVATRAVADAMPFLMRAKKIELIIISGDRPIRNELPGADIAQHLARHDLKVDVKALSMATDAATTILNFAADTGADMLVMGAYGHSRLREFILGGATRGILETMTVPTLMSH